MDHDFKKRAEKIVDLISDRVISSEDYGVRNELYEILENHFNVIYNKGVAHGWQGATEVLIEKRKTFQL